MPRLTVETIANIAGQQGYKIERKQSGEVLMYKQSGRDLHGIVAHSGKYYALYMDRKCFREGMRLPNLATVTSHLGLDRPTNPPCPLCNRPLTVQIQSSGSIQNLCRRGMRAGDCGYSVTLGGRKRGGQSIGPEPMTEAEKKRRQRRLAKESKAQGEGDKK